MSAWLDIIGVGAGGLAELPATTRSRLAEAELVIGPERLIAGLGPEVTRAKWETPLAAMLAQVMARRGRPTAILATGDPMWFGIGATLARELDRGEFRVFPQLSAFQFAAARLGWPLQEVATVSLHGRPVATLHRHVLPGRRVLALTGGRETAGEVAALLIGRRYGASRLILLENLGGPDERVRETTADEFSSGDLGEFYVLGLECRADPGAPLLPPVPGLPDEAFVHDGQLTKREVRTAALAKLAPFPGALLWDVGAGCGSISIEWLRAAPGARALAFERNAARRAMIADNAVALGVPALEIVAGEVPASLAGQPTPDAVFLGGAVAGEALFETCWQALRPGGRLLAHAATLEAEEALFRRHAALGGELTRIDVSVLDLVGGRRVLRPRLPVTQWLAVKP